PLKTFIQRIGLVRAAEGYIALAAVVDGRHRNAHSRANAVAGRVPATMGDQHRDRRHGRRSRLRPKMVSLPALRRAPGNSMDEKKSQPRRLGERAGAAPENGRSGYYQTHLRHRAHCRGATSKAGTSFTNVCNP